MKSDDIQCHSCMTLVTNLTSPNCSRTVEECDGGSNFCGISVLSRNNTGAVYRESCVPHGLCDDTSRHWKRSAYLYCCYKSFCNHYDTAIKVVNVHDGLANITEMIARTLNVQLISFYNATSSSTLSHGDNTATSPSTPKQGDTKPTGDKTTTSLASFLKCRKFVKVMLLLLILEIIF